MEKVQALVVGGGQAGIAMSEHLQRIGLQHVVLEKARIAENWRTARWDSLVANGPAWHDRFPNRTFSSDPDGFPGKEEVADYMAGYAAQINAPIRTGVTVTKVRRLDSRAGFRVETSAGDFEADYVISATGPFQKPVIPQMVEDPAITQLHSTAYRNPQSLPEGGVLVVGAGSSGAQIAEELRRAGRKTWIAVGPHGRPPRAYRGRDFCWWLGVLNKWDMEYQPGNEHVTIAVSGAYGGRTMDFRRLAHEGLILTGRAEAYDNGVMTFANDLAANIAKGDADYLAVLAEADAFVTAHGLTLPEEPEAHVIPPDPDCVTHPIRSLDLKAEGIRTIIWATGFENDYSWLDVPVVKDNKPQHKRGVTDVTGFYFVGLPWLSRRGSAFIWGVWHDAKFVADHIDKLQNYLAYQGAAE
ncbi:flavin-containing monooxygenase [Stagnihabitans tardus]|uniref:NAD(P)-binding domain-containing protein n=1 Tax=Stagnihabitans tardus TaxID=2699202 RepID=A0AAE4Y6P7_9RHOB|nr:NAD(P)/FAD-dependent oxidoreductase [Stagnihabitans tardus]NBZ86866.1 NAD(P)-binding domain-containing protein [Stagnihabitans tardus]